MNHTPATPLPEMGVNINGDFGAQNWRADPPRGMHQRLSLAEKKEAARRCNAYPKLVEALRAASRELWQALGGGDDDDCRTIADARCKRFDSLLRELGEDA